ncbi:MAG: hypothetical protein JNL82_08925 [Myxococcales bacterium]|jgi:hypothetical protein|nr:hypothetical protein [Myxococcales bacterium]
MRTHPPDELAQAMHRRLASTFWLHRPRVTVRLAGAGLDWWCEAASAARRCRVQCHSGRDAEFCVGLEGDGEAMWGRTGSRSETVEVARMWLAGASGAEVCARWPFIDAARRAFAELQELVMASDPAMGARVVAQAIHAGEDRHRLRFDGNDRSIQLAFYGKNPHPDATLVWDDFTIAETMVVDRPAFAAIVRAWLVERAEPTEMKREFPWLVLRRDSPGVIPDD